MFQLFKNVFIYPSQKRIPCCVDSPENINLDWLLFCARQPSMSTVEQVSKLDYMTLILDYFIELYPQASSQAIEKLFTLSLSRTSLLPMRFSDLETLDFPQFPVHEYIAQKKAENMIDGELRKVVPLEFLLADHLNHGKYDDVFVSEFMNFLRICLRQTVQEIRQEILYKVYHIHRLAPDLDRNLPLDHAIAKHPKLRFLLDRNNTYNPRDVLTLYEEFVDLYKRGYGITSVESTMQGKFLSLVVDALESKDPCRCLSDDIKRPYSVFFSTNTFTEKNNPLIVDYFYDLVRTNSEMLKQYRL